METSRKSSLKEWDSRIVIRSGKKLLGIICPNCGGRALVSRSWLNVEPSQEAVEIARRKGDYKGTVFRTRCCTYCFKGAWLPGEHPDRNHA
jgi:hypothetical protein